MKVAGLFPPSWLTLSSVLCHFANAKVDEWTPADFPWDQQRVGAPETWNALFHNLSDPTTEVPREVMALGRVHDMEDSTQLLALPFSLTTAWQFISVGMSGAGLASAIHGCVKNDGSAESDTFLRTRSLFDDRRRSRFCICG